MHQTVAASYETQADAIAAIEALGTTDIRDDQISLMMSEKTHRMRLATTDTDRVAQGSAAGGFVGLVLGGAVALTSLVLPGAGLLVVSGPILALLSGMGVGAATGGALGALIGLGISETEARLIQQDIEAGAIVVAVSTTDQAQAERAVEVLRARHPMRLTRYAVPTAEDAHAPSVAARPGSLG
jgi:hypothetical protein